MADTNKIYNRLTQWKLGDPITPTELQKISDSLQAVSQQFGNLIGEQQWNALQENNGLQTVLNDLIMFGYNVQDTSKYTKLFIEAQPTVAYEIPTLDDLNSIIGAKKYIVGNTYEVNDYITYKGSLYKVLNLIENCASDIHNNDINKVYLLGSEGTIDSKIFQNELEKYGITCNVPSEEDYKTLRDVIEAVKQNKYTIETEKKLFSSPRIASLSDSEMIFSISFILLASIVAYVFTSIPIYTVYP